MFDDAGDIENDESFSLIYSSGNVLNSTFSAIASGFVAAFSGDVAVLEWLAGVWQISGLERHSCLVGHGPATLQREIAIPRHSSASGHAVAKATADPAFGFDDARSDLEEPKSECRELGLGEILDLWDSVADGEHQPYVDGPLLARYFRNSMIRSLASICPACECARS